MKILSLDHLTWNLGQVDAVATTYAVQFFMHLSLLLTIKVAREEKKSSTLTEVTKKQMTFGCCSFNNRSGLSKY